MRIEPICAKCGHPLDYETTNGLCLSCGWKNVYAGLSTEEDQSRAHRDFSYEFDPGSSPIREDAWGYYYLGKCYSNADSHFVKNVSVCVLSDNKSDYAYPVIKLLNEISHIDFSQTVFVPVIDIVPFGRGYCLIEEFTDGVSLYDLMQGKLVGADGDSNDFAVKMHDLYIKNREYFTKVVGKEILKGIKFIHEHEICARFIEPPESIIFTANGEIKIRMMNSLFHECWLHRRMGITIRHETVCSLLPFEYSSPEEWNLHQPERAHIDKKSDFYCVGILLFCIITGHLPKGANLQDAHRIHSPNFNALWDEKDGRLLTSFWLESLHKFEEELYLGEINDKHFRQVIEKATKRNLNQRFQSATVFMDALDGGEVVKCDEPVDESIDEKSPLYKSITSFLPGFRKQSLICLLLLLSYCAFICPELIAQTHIRLCYKSGGHSDIPISQIDSIMFVNDDEGQAEIAELTGSWLWGDTDAGYYELLTFNDDKTYTGYDNYFTHGFDTMTYGWYMQMGSMLTLLSNGYGYNRRYHWLVMGLTDNALDVMTKMGRFTYYKLQPEEIQLKAGEEPLACEEGDSFVFADGVIARIVGNKLLGIAKGTTYIQKYNTSSNMIYSYKVIVE